MLDLPDTFILFTGAVGFAVASTFGLAVGIAIGAFIVLAATIAQIMR